MRADGSIFTVEDTVPIAPPTPVSKLDKTFGGIEWSTPIGFFGTPVLLGADVVVFGGGPDFEAARLDGTSGTLLWSVAVDGTAGLDDFPVNAAIDAAGDVVLAGIVNRDGSSNVDLGVVKLSGVDGSELWRYELDDGFQEIMGQVAVTPIGDVVVAASTGTLGSHVATVLRLDGASGALAWRVDLLEPGFTSFGVGVGVDGAGEILVTTLLRFGSVFTDTLVAKLAFADGSETWRRISAISGETFNAESAVDGAGDLVWCAGGTVQKIAGATGSVAWTRSDAGTSCNGLTIAPGNDVLATDYDTVDAGVVRRLSGATGAVLWRTDPGKTISPLGPAFADAAGDVAAFGNGVIVLRGADGDGQMIDDGSLLCQQALDKAGMKYMKKRLLSLAKCRDGINDGTLAIAPAQCLTEPKTAVALAGAGAKVRTTLAARCPDPVLTGLVACDTTLDGVIAASGDAGCFLDAHVPAVDDAITAAYGTTSPLSAAEATCQRAIGKGALIYANAVYKGRRKEIETFVKGAIFDFVKQSVKTAQAGTRARKVIDTACTDALVAALGLCATTLDDLVTGDHFGGGCLRTSIDAAVNAAVPSIYAP